MKRRAVNVFNLSFLDIITCGLGAVILLFVLVNAKSAAQRDSITSDFRAEAERVEQEVLDAKKELVLARNTLEQTEAQRVRTEGLSRKIIEILEQKKVELSDRQEDTLATTEHVNKLKADLKSIEEELKRLRAGAKTEDDQGSRLRKFPGEGDRQYLTDLKMGGKRIFILVDASASMLDETVVGVIRRRNLSAKEKLKSPKWQQTVATVNWLATQLPSTSQFQIYAFNEDASPLLAGTAGAWLDAGNVDQLNQAANGIRSVIPQKGTSLLNAITALRTMKPAPDNIFLLTDGLPTMGKGKPWRKRVSSDKRLSLFKAAIGELPKAPVNVILYPMEGDPLAADAYWRLAKRTRGSFFSPSKDWP
ncbi:MAG: hypothetical protein QNJ26_17085 [Desulfobacterales bacterium]|nr:hypothetical protein [Desulfobacterales bacterium]